MPLPYLRLAIAFAMLGSTRLAAQCTMAYNVSIYSNGSPNADFSSVYAYSSTVDNSTKCSCTHSSYQTTVNLYGPNGANANSTQAGFQSSVNMDTNGVAGTYTAVGTANLYCSCAGQVGAGGERRADHSLQY